jgi:lipopolysaccharide transport system permease protein
MTGRRLYSSSLVRMMGSMVHHRHLIWQLARREVLGRYRGSMIGLAWSFVNPILMLGVYTFFFTVAFKARWGGSQPLDHGSYALVLFIGLIVHSIFADAMNRAPALITQNVNFVKKVVFPLEILPLVSVTVSLFHALISTLVLLAAELLLTGGIQWTSLFFPLIIAPYVVLIIGIGWILSSVGVYVRDIVHVMGVFTTILLFLSPVFYPVSSLPAIVQPWIMLNPLTFIIEQSRAVMIYGQVPDWQGLAVYTLISLAGAKFGFWWFQKMRKGFADVL